MYEARKSAPPSRALRAETFNENFASKYKRWSIKSSTILWPVSTLFLMSTVLEGPIRYYLSLGSIAQLAYLPKVLLAAAIVPLLLGSTSLRNSVFVTITFAASICWGMLNLSSIQQALFGAWVFVPFLYGMVAGRHLIEGPAYRWTLLAILLIAISGVFLSPFVSFAWSGSEMAIGDRNIQVSRQWTSMGIDRHAGFARASYSAAAQILMLSVLLVLGIRSRMATLSLWMMAGAAIALTTAKGAAATWVLLSMFFISRVAFRNSKRWKAFWSFFIWVTLTAVVALPISTLLYLHTPESQTKSFLLSSFVERMTWMWPDSFALLQDPTEWLLGRGIGGIGAAQQYFDPTNYLPADNIFVYLSVIVGPLLAIALLTLLTRQASFSLVRLEGSTRTFALVLCIMLYGLVANVVEEPFLAFFLGASVATLQSRSERHERRHAQDHY